MVPLVRAAEISSLEGNYAAIGAFNVNIRAQAEGILEGLSRAEAPGIIQASRGACTFQGGADKILYIVLDVMDKMGVDDLPLALHLDHGTVETAKDCVDSGFSSVMIDASKLDFDENIAATNEVAEYAHRMGVSVEGEYGGLGGIEEDVEHEKVTLSDPLRVPLFLRDSGADALAITYGTSHGPNKNIKGRDIEKALRIQIVRDSYAALTAYHMNLSKFLVGHGSSTVPEELVARINEYGGRLKVTGGVPVYKITEARNAGIRKFNIDTDIRLVITATVRKYFHDHPGVEDESEALRLIKDVFDGKLEAVDIKTGETIPPEEMIDPRLYLNPLDKELLREDYRGTDMEELMMLIRNNVADHVEMLVRDVFNSAGLAPKVERVSMEQMANLYKQLD